MVLGVTGGIASGKSSVAAMLGECGAALVSADQLAREAVCVGSDALSRLVAVFGPGILAADGSLDRPSLAERIFQDPQSREKLNAITHPAIARLAEERLFSLRNEEVPLIAYEAALLFEAGATRRVDRVLVVLIEPEQQIERLCRRDSVTPAQARQRIASQWPQSGKVARADFVIDNSGSLQDTRRQVVALYDHLVLDRQA